MAVYFITVSLVIILSGLAQSVDRPYQSNYDGLQVVHTQSARFFLFLTTAILVFVSGFRFRVGTDYGAYYYGYLSYAQDFVKATVGLKEPGYPLLCRIAILLGGDGATAIFLAALVTIWPALRTIYKHTDQLLLASMLYIFLGCWDGSFNGVRQYLAATMLFCGYDYLEARNLRKYLFWVFIAFLFHRSAIVMAALYFVVHRKISIRNLLVLFLGSILALLAYDRVISFAGWITESQYIMTDEYATHQVNILRVLAALAPAVLFLILYAPEQKNPRETMYLNMLVIHAAMRVATMNSALLYRIGIYTTLFQTIAIAELLKGVKPTTRRTVLFFMIPLFAIFWWYEISHNGSTSVFHWIWERA